MRTIADFSMSEQGHSYRVANATRVINTFTVDGSGVNTFTPSTTANRPVITDILLSAVNAATITLSGSDSDAIPFHLGDNDSIVLNLSEYAPISGETGESFATTCTFTDAATGLASTALFGYMETGNSYSS